ncbi:putative ribosomal protein L5 [Tanacetum coccineum]
MASERHSFYAEHIILGIFRSIRRNKVTGISSHQVLVLIGTARYTVRSFGIGVMKIWHAMSLLGETRQCNFWFDPSTGINGMDSFVVLECPGYRDGHRCKCEARVGIQNSHKGRFNQMVSGDS